MIDKIMAYFEARQLVLPTPEEALLWAWTELTEFNAAKGHWHKERTEEAGDLIMMLFVFMRVANIEFDPFAKQPDIDDGMKLITEAWMSQRAFVRNNPEDKPTTADLTNLVSGVIMRLANVGYTIDGRDGEYRHIQAVEALQAKMKRKVEEHGFGPREGTGYRDQ